MATPQLLSEPDLDYLVYDYLAEITMEIMARAKAKDPSMGYATDFVGAVIKPNLADIEAKGVRVIANAGGLNPAACGAAVQNLIAAAGLDLTVAVITGDDQIDTIDAIHAVDMFSGAPMPERGAIQSANVYLGAVPIAKALAAGADIVITGRCVDSALTLGACLNEFGWPIDDWDKLASGSLAGHILECGPQATGGNFTDWEAAGDITHIGYPVAEIAQDGSFILTKPDGTLGVVNRGTVTEQMLYEIGDPQRYILPDVVCDFTHVEVTEVGPDRVSVSPARGLAAPTSYKTCVTFQDGFRAGGYLTLYGARSTAKAEALAASIFARAGEALTAEGLSNFTETSSEIIGGGGQMGERIDASEVVLKLAVKHENASGVSIFLKAMTGIGLASPPGLSGFTGAGRPRPSPVMRLFSYLTTKSNVEVKIQVGDTRIIHKDTMPPQTHPIIEVIKPKPITPQSDWISVPLERLAFARSGDKGDTANIGVIARESDYLPYIWAALSEARIAEIFDHFMTGKDTVSRFYLPGSHAMNITIETVLGGGGTASLRNDAQGKGYAQILLGTPILMPSSIV